MAITLETEEILCADLTTTGTLVAVPCRVRTLFLEPSNSPGTLVFRDGGAGGTIKCTINSPGSVAAATSIDIPGRGMVFETDCHITFANVSGLTAWYSATILDF